MTTNYSRCSKCNSLLTYIRFNSGIRVCRSCGFMEKIKIDKLKFNDKNLKGGNK